MLKVYKKDLGDVAVLCLQGGIVTGETSGLRDAVLSQSEAVAVVLDLARVSRIDAGGLGVLLELREHTLARGKEFKLLNVTKLVQKVFAITRLNSVFEILSERGAALAASPGRPPVVLKAACA